MAMTLAASSSVVVMIPRVSTVSYLPPLPPRSFGRSSFTVPLKLVSGDRFIFSQSLFPGLMQSENSRQNFCIIITCLNLEYSDRILRFSGAAVRFSC